MKIFLTGGTGFIGSHFVQQALSAGHEVLALRRSKTSVAKIELDSEPQWLDKQLTEVELNDLRGYDVLVHLAAHSANVPYDTIENCIMHNVIDPLSLFRKAVDAGVSSIIVAGSCFEYGRSGERYENIPVDAPLEPTMSYPASKAAATSAFYAFACENNIKMQFLRIFQTYGEGELETRFWPSLKRCAEAGEDMEMTSGAQVRDFMHVRDVAAAFVDAITDDEVDTGSPVIKHVGSGKPMSLAEFAKQEWQRFDAKGALVLGAVEQRKNEVMRFVPEI